MEDTDQNKVFYVKGGSLFKVGTNYFLATNQWETLDGSQYHSESLEDLTSENPFISLDSLERDCVSLLDGTVVQFDSRSTYDKLCSEAIIKEL